MKHSGMPSVVIVGRTNVGKSTLFNRLSMGTKSITLDQEGVTRDFIKNTVSWRDRSFELIDTGGITVRKSPDIITEQVRKKAIALMEKASLLLFVCDGAAGLVPEDRELGNFLRTFGKKVFLIVNKMDRKDAQEKADEFEVFGYPIVTIAAQHARGIGDVLDTIVDNLPAQTYAAADTHERICKTVLLGKPNVGKSSLMNLLVKQERSIVHNEPGTTREPISERITFYKEDLLVTDTAGIRRQRSVSEPLETLMVKSSLRAIEAADIVLLLVDSAAGQLSDQELKLAFYVFDRQKALILLFNKQDLVDEQIKQDLEHSLEEYTHILDKVPHLSISCKTGKNVGKVLPLIQTIWERYNQTFSDEELSLFCKDALLHKPLYHKISSLSIGRDTPRRLNLPTGSKPVANKGNAVRSV